MGILKGGILGPVVNKTGNAVGRMHKGKNVVSALPRTSKASTSARQKKNRNRLGLLSNFLSQIDDLVRRGFKHYSKGKDAVNVAMSYNYDHAFLVNELGTSLNYPQIQYSRGYIAEPESPGIAALTGQIEFSWLPQKQSNYCRFSDMATIMIYNPVKDQFLRLKEATDRYAQGFVVNVTGWAGDSVHCYMSFASQNGKLQGNSSYVGEVVCV